MTYEKSYQVKDDHIDVQGIMDGLYYPFYMEWCRHDFVKEQLGFDLEAKAKEGTNMVLSQYTIKFKRPLKKGDELIVTCSAHPDKEGKPRFHLKQEILCDGKVMTEGTFSATCISADGGRPFIPANIVEKLEGIEAV
jgi:acyl-CoA thioester hydrolase